MKIQKAIVFATLAHEGQCRKGTNIPYIVHPMEVMQILTANGCNETVILAGILHDTLEDTQTTPEDILHNFGQDVLDLVLGESEDKSKSWQERKQATIDHLADASKEIQLVCCTDNCRTSETSMLTSSYLVMMSSNASTHRRKRSDGTMKASPML